MKRVFIAISICLSICILSFTEGPNKEQYSSIENEKIHIEVITDINKVKKIQAEVQAKIKAKQALQPEINPSKALFERYRMEDKTALLPILEILKGSDDDKRADVYAFLQSLKMPFEDAPVFEPELIEAVFARIHDAKDQNMVIQTVAYLNMKGYVDLLERQLLSGKYNEESRILYWLGIEGKSSLGLEFISKKIYADIENDTVNDWTIYSLQNYLVSKDTQIRKKMLELAIALQESKLIRKERYEELSTAWSALNPATTVLQILFKLGDKRILPLAEDMYGKNIEPKNAFRTMLRLDGKKYKEQIIQKLENPETYKDVSSYGFYLYSYAREEDIIMSQLIGFGKCKDMPLRFYDEIVNGLKKVNALGYLDQLEEYIKDPAVNEKIRIRNQISKGDAKSFAHELYHNKVVANLFADNIMHHAARIQRSENSAQVLNAFLDISGICSRIIFETGIYPINYDALLENMIKNSLIKDAIVSCDVAGNVNNYNVKYKITIVANKKVYIVKADESGDAPNLDILVQLMNTVAADAGLKEKFVRVEYNEGVATILFGFEEKINLMYHNYFQ